jgi:hypothetical protein
MFNNKHTLHCWRQHEACFTNNWLKSNEYKEMHQNHRLNGVTGVQCWQWAWLNVQCLRIGNVMQSRTTNVVLLLKTSVFISYLFRISSFLSFVFLSSYVFLHTFISERDCTLLQCFYKGCTQSNQQLALSLLMHSIHCGSAVFPYQALKRSAQETDKLCGTA